MTTENPTRDPATKTHHELESIVGNLIGIGATWARYGLTVGCSALETSAKTLTATAGILGDLAKQFEEKAAAAKTPGNESDIKHA